jgi:hypothetical protein
MMDNTTPSGELVVDGGFESGLAPWTYDNVFGASFGGFVDTSGNCASTLGVPLGLAPNSGTADWCDGATQAYDAIDQLIATTIGDSYTVSFWVDQANSYEWESDYGRQWNRCAGVCAGGAAASGYARAGHVVFGGWRADGYGVVEDGL